jgi:hypothetical protein
MEGHDSSYFGVGGLQLWANMKNYVDLNNFLSFEYFLYLTQLNRGFCIILGVIAPLLVLKRRDLNIRKYGCIVEYIPTLVTCGSLWYLYVERRNGAQHLLHESHEGSQVLKIQKVKQKDFPSESQSQLISTNKIRFTKFIFFLYVM